MDFKIKKADVVYPQYHVQKSYDANSYLYNMNGVYINKFGTVIFNIWRFADNSIEMTLYFMHPDLPCYSASMSSMGIPSERSIKVTCFKFTQHMLDYFKDVKS